MAARDDDFDPRASGSESDDDVISDDVDADPLVGRYRARAAQTEAMAAAQLDALPSDDEEEPEVEDTSLWGTCVEDVDRCKTLCGFTPGEFLELYAECEEYLEEHVGRGKRSKISKHDRLLMLLVFLKHYETNARLAQTFRISKGHVQKCVAATMDAVVVPLWQRYVASVDLDEAPRFAEFPGVVAMMDVTAQPIWTPEGAYDEKKRYYSGKHKMYAIKSQCVHDLRGLVISIVTNIPGATHDVTVAQRTLTEIERVVRPRKPRDEDSDPRIDADGSNEDEDAENGRLLMVDSGYQGLQHIVPCVLPYKKRANRPLTAQEKQHNRRLSRRRVLVENYYGRLKRRYRIMTDKYRGERGAYPAYFKLCVALTNFHIMKHPLREE